jgi:MFS family permease
MKSRYPVWRSVPGYLAGATTARLGDEMSGPALVLLGYAVTGAPAAGSALLAALTIAAAAGGPVFGALLDRAARPERLLAVTLAGYALGILAISAGLGRLPLAAMIVIALAAGILNPAVAGGWTAQLPRLVTAGSLERASALDGLTYSTAGLAGPGLAAVVAAVAGARLAVIAAAALVGLAAPAALAAWRQVGPPLPPRSPAAPTAKAGPPMARKSQFRPAAGLAAIAALPRLRRATATSLVSYVGVGMLLVCCPVLGVQRLGGAARGPLLISAMAAACLGANALLARRRFRREPDFRVLASTLILAVSMAAVAFAPGWLTLLAVAIGGAGEGPQLTALFAVRHRDAPEHMRGQVFSTAASLKIAGLSAGAALAGPLVGWSLTGCLLAAAAAELCAAATYLLAGPARKRRPADTLPDTEHLVPEPHAAHP